MEILCWWERSEGNGLADVDRTLITTVYNRGEQKSISEWKTKSNVEVQQTIVSGSAPVKQEQQWKRSMSRSNRPLSLAPWTLVRVRWTSVTSAGVRSECGATGDWQHECAADKDVMQSCQRGVWSQRTVSNIWYNHWHKEQRRHREQRQLVHCSSSVVTIHLELQPGNLLLITYSAQYLIAEEEPHVHLLFLHSCLDSDGSYEERCMQFKMINQSTVLQYTTPLCTDTWAKP